MASVKGMACTARLCHFYSCVSTSAFRLSPVKVSSLFPFTGLYMLRFRWIGELQPVSPMAGKQRFDSVTQHNHSLYVAFYSLNPSSLFPALDAMVRHDIAKSSG